jgi:putative ABC transport system permease protein
VAFAILPLLQIRTVSPLSALRKRVEPLRIARADPVRWFAWALLASSVLLLIVYQAGSLLVGSIVTAAIGGTLLVLWVAARTVTTVLRRTPRSALAYPVRQGIANLYRPGNQTATVVLALGFGVYLIGTLLLTQSNILRPLTVDAESRGNLLLFDVQEDQAAGVEAVLTREGATVIQGAALVPMRIAAINGVTVERSLGAAPEPEPDEFAQPDGEQASGWAVRREYRSTYRDSLQASETLVEGEWWEPGRTAPQDLYQVSLDRDVAAELNVGVGDRIDWDVQGIRVRTTVTSLRVVDWARFEPNFYAVFEPAALRGAPQMWVFLARAEDASARAVVQREIVTNYPNIASIDLTLVQRALDDVIGRISLVIRFLAGFSVATGFIVLLGAVATGRLQRIRESVLLKTLGATRRQIGMILFTEYAFLGLLAVAVGIGLAMAAGWGLARFLFNVDFGVDPLPILGLATGIALLSATIGLSASREVFRSTPMEAIREE